MRELILNSHEVIASIAGQISWLNRYRQALSTAVSFISCTSLWLKLLVAWF